LSTLSDLFSTRVELAIDLKTATAPGLAVPPSLFIRAAEIVE